MGARTGVPDSTDGDRGYGGPAAARRVLLVASLVLFVAGCTTTSMRPPTEPEQPTVWARKDGQRIGGNPALVAQGRVDEAECRAEATDADGNFAMTAMEACMDARGYRIMTLPPGETFVPVAAPAAEE